MPRDTGAGWSGVLDALRDSWLAVFGDVRHLAQRRERRAWAARQKAARPGRYYGDGGTIHAATRLDVETYNGAVVAVWFRCQQLPFSQTEATAQRATQMQAMSGLPLLTGVEVLDPPVN